MIEIGGSRYLTQIQIFKIFGLLQKNRPHLEIFKDDIYQRLFEFSINNNSNNVKSLSISAFDRNENIQKKIEVFTEKSNNHCLKKLINIIKLSKNLFRSDFVLQILNSYFLDDEQLFYAIEYEFFDYSTDQINQISQQNTPTINQNIQLRDYLYKIFENHVQIINPTMQTSHVQYWFEKQAYSFVFQKQPNQHFKVKINIIGFDLLDENYFVSSKINKNQIMDWPIYFQKQELDFEIKQENLLNEIKKYKPIIYEQHKEIFQQIIQEKKQITIFKPTIFMEDQSYFAFIVSEGDEKYQLVVEYYQNEQEAQLNYEKINQQINLLSNFQIESAIKKLILIHNKQGIYIVKYLNDQIYNFDYQDFQLLSEFIHKPILTQDDQFEVNFQQEQNKVEFYLKLIKKLLNYSKDLIEIGIHPTNVKLTETTSIIVKDAYESSKFNNNPQSYQIMSELYSQLIIEYLHKTLKIKQMNGKLKNLTFTLSEKNIGNYCLQNSFNLFKIMDVIQFLKENQNIEFCQQTILNLMEKMFCSIQPVFQSQGNEISEMVRQLLFDKFFHLNENGLSIQKIECIKQIVFEQTKDINLQYLNQLENVSQSSRICLDCADNLQSWIGRKDQLVQIIERYYDEILSKEIGEVFNNNACICYKNVKIQNYLTRILPNLKKIEYCITKNYTCQTIQKELIQQVDFFDLKNKKQVVEIQIYMHEKQVSMLFNQLKNNGQNINTLRLGFCKDLYDFQNPPKQYLFYKLKYLVTYQQL
ncbi:hypothetical protein TTHERM_00361660 (macronuclear) [Tetrahymena thermophila SB210]|uniref:Uncharacterized protein n=1 Tax=Tetrahymena thermophila (strain SB210) TaxID=312017 RepID=Q22PH8_TETTS|nr:hypothetical protein TTHERM_00361660 [Tetrahymena thermophila SB210]EAR87131.1 hypothetical protein TTHERM_00361660 [Tetrahymena thermophila SB210]|eukprot:XP_001007376.1 hypothetical protein TTHERM_00361660 [Tetrahymena thermophila SB210]